MEWKPDGGLLDSLYDPRMQDYAPKPLVWALLSLVEADDILACLSESRSSEESTMWTALALDSSDLIVVTATSDETNWRWESRDGEHRVSARRIPRRRILELRVSKVEAVYRGAISSGTTAWAAEYEIEIEGGEKIVLPSAIKARDQQRREEIEHFWKVLTDSRTS